MSTVGRGVLSVVSLVEPPLVRLLRLENRLPPLFVVGAPRSGTTAVYLHLLGRFRMGYFPNLAKRHPRACVSALLWGRAFGRRHRPTYAHEYGDVAGDMAPSDGWDVFHRWFPRYDHDRPVREGRLHELRTVVRLYEILFDAPFCNKNNSNSLRIPHLARLFPDALFVHVRRDPVATVLSLVEARARHGVGPGEWWSASPPRFLGRRFTDPVEQAVFQTWGVERHLRDSLDDLPAERWTGVDYERVSRDATALEDWVRDRYTAHGIRLDLRETPPAGELRPSRVRGGKPELVSRVEKLLVRLDEEEGPPLTAEPASLDSSAAERPGETG